MGDEIEVIVDLPTDVEQERRPTWVVGRNLWQYSPGRGIQTVCPQSSTMESIPVDKVRLGPQ